MSHLVTHDHGRTMVTVVIMVDFIAVFLYMKYIYILKCDYSKVPWSYHGTTMVVQHVKPHGTTMVAWCIIKKVQQWCHL